MPQNPHRQCLIPPPKGRPHWFPSTTISLELNYLSWGHRWYGDSPIEQSLHAGWHYFIVLEGSPLLLIGQRQMRARRGTATICHPDCPVGHIDQPGRRCQILTWIWASPPTHSALRPTPGGHLKMSLDNELLRRAKNIHAKCREAVAQANERSRLLLQAARLNLDLCLVEAREYRQSADNDLRINLAIEYLRHHLDELEPVKNLCEYMQMSEASLKRLFHDRTGKSPRAFALEWRMRWAHEHLLPDQTSVKAVAYALGYRHANDFSRAFKRFFGIEAKHLLKPDHPATAIAASVSQPNAVTGSPAKNGTAITLARR